MLLCLQVDVAFFALVSKMLVRMAAKATRCRMCSNEEVGLRVLRELSRDHMQANKRSSSSPSGLRCAALLHPHYRSESEREVLVFSLVLVVFLLICLLILPRPRKRHQQQVQSQKVALSLPRPLEPTNYPWRLATGYINVTRRLRARGLLIRVRVPK